MTTNPFAETSDPLIFTFSNHGKFLSNETIRGNWKNYEYKIFQQRFYNTDSYDFLNIKFNGNDAVNFDLFRINVTTLNGELIFSKDFVKDEDCSIWFANKFEDLSKYPCFSQTSTVFLNKFILRYRSNPVNTDNQIYVVSQIRT